MPVSACSTESTTEHVSIRDGQTESWTSNYADTNGDPYPLLSAGYTGVLNIKEFVKSPDTLISLSSALGHITFSDAFPNVTVTAPSALTGGLDFEYGIGDLKLSVGGVLSKSFRIPFRYFPLT